MKIYKVAITRIVCRGGGTGPIEFFSVRFNVFSNKQKALDYAYEQISLLRENDKLEYNDSGCYKISNNQDEYGGYEFPEIEIITTQDTMDLDSDILVSKSITYGG